MFPHYFEKQKTDGVDHQIYVGGSLLEDGRFDPLYLKNLRLWQLMVVCGIAARAEQLEGRLPIPLRDDAPDPRPARAAVHPLPLRREALRRGRRVRRPLRDRQEAHRQGGHPRHHERLTQPGRIAIVYSQAAEAARVPRLHRVPPAPGYLTARGGGPRAGGAAGRQRAARAPRDGRPPRRRGRSGSRPGDRPRHDPRVILPAWP